MDVLQDSFFETQKRMKRIFSGGVKAKAKWDSNILKWSCLTLYIHMYIFIPLNGLCSSKSLSDSWHDCKFKRCSSNPWGLCTSRWWTTYSKHQMMWIDFKIILWSEMLLLKVFSLFIWQQGKKKVRKKQKQIRVVYKRKKKPFRKDWKQNWWQDTQRNFSIFFEELYFH